MNVVRRRRTASSTPRTKYEANTLTLFTALMVTFSCIKVSQNWSTCAAINSAASVTIIPEDRECPVGFDFEYLEHEYIL
jgi:hypothetical protein